MLKEISRVKKTLIRIFCIGLAALFILALCALYALYIEPTWIKTRRLDLATKPSLHIIHITDLHYKGNRPYLERIVKIINATPADMVCITGDFVEDCEWSEECLSILSAINKPMYGIPGNHDEWAHVSNAEFSSAFRQSGGNWLVDTNFTLPGKSIELFSSSGRLDHLRNLPVTTNIRILMAHYPLTADHLPSNSFHLILAGHTHGGQIRIPFLGSKIIPFNITPYELGLYKTPAGPLYVNPGIGTYYWNVRFLCRPEITIIGL